MSKRGGGVPPGDGLDDVQMLGIWNFTLQGDTPLYWIRSGSLERYLLKFTAHSLMPATFGIIIHAEADGSGTDGASFWIERRMRSTGEGSKRYLVAGEGLTSKPIVTRSFPDEGGEHAEDIELLMEGYKGTILLQDRKVQLRFKIKQSKGCLAFYNTTQAEQDDVHFADVRITALRRGPLELSGVLARRERSMLKMEEREQAAEAVAVAAEAAAEAEETAYSPTKGGFGSDGHLASMSTTLGPGSMSQQRFTQSMTSFGGQPSASVKDPTQRLPRVGGKSQAASPKFGLTPSGGGSGRAGGFRHSASDGMLRKGISPAASVASPGPRGGERWLPLATNAPVSEQKLLQGAAGRRAGNSRSCNDFIPM